MENNPKVWYYYLHTNGDLISKHPRVVESDPDYFDSPFVQKVWKMDFTDRYDAWKLILEALALKCRIDRAKELAKKWNLTYEDSLEMLVRIIPNEVTELMRAGLTIFIEMILKMDDDIYWDKVKEYMDAKK